MDLLLFKILLILLLRASSSYSLDKITIQVSDTGLDVPSCMQNGETCKTLAYVLGGLSQFDSTVVTVNITCNQTITKYAQHLLYPFDFLSVIIVSQNNAYIWLNSSMRITYDSIGSNIYWAWIGLGFISSTDRIRSVIMYHDSLTSLAIISCRIMAAEWKFKSVQSLEINNSEFGKVNVCPTLHISLNFEFIFSNNTISHCMTDKSIFYFNENEVPHEGTHLTIVNCTFTALKGAEGTRDAATTSNPGNAVVQNNSILISIETSFDYILSINNSQFTDIKQLTLVSINVFIGRRIYPMSVRLTLYDTIIKNNTATSVLVEFNGLYRYKYFSMTVILKDLLVDGNLVTNTQRAYAASIISLSTVDEVLIENSSFLGNQGTPLTVTHNEKTYLSLEGEIYFINNTGVFGGGCGLHNANVMIQRNDEVNIIFQDNSGVYGGAVYLNNTTISDATCKLKVKFINNTAITSGNSVYFATTPRGVLPNCSFSDIKFTDISAPAFNMSYYEDDTLFSLIPGQSIYINVSVTDYFGSPSSCTADVFIMCDNWIFICLRKHIQLNGPEHVVLAQKELGIYTEGDTKLPISAPQVLGDSNVQLLLKCRNDIQTEMVITLEISRCPLGFVYNINESVCKCANLTTNHGTVICSENLGVACITQGYWYGPFNIDNTTTYVSARCSYPDCSYFYKQCPAKMLSLGFAGDYKLIGLEPDEQCSIGRGGLLCKSCAHDYQYTFLSVSCVASSTCEWWQPYLVLVITLVFQLMIAMGLMAVVRFKIATGSGFLYGPMLFLAIISHLPLDTNPNLFTLRTSVLIITAIPLLNPEPFGLIPWCFFEFNKIYNYTLRYLGPLTVLLVIGFTTIKARWCPRALLKWQNSRLRALCILMLLSFWSLADITMNITFNILTSTRLLSNNDVIVSVVALEPQMKYFSLKHIPIVILALLVLLIVIAPLLVVLLVSPALSRVINLTRIKPFLDEFQSCYRDSCRWYSTVYFIVWIGFVSMQSQAVPMIYIQALFMILLSTHFLIRPYQSRVLNITDTLILVDINFLFVLLQSKASLTMIVLLHILVLIPILGIGAWFLCVLLIKCGVCRYFHHKLQIKRGQQPLSTGRMQRYEERMPSPPNVPVQEVAIYESNAEREPLIGIVEDI